MNHFHLTGLKGRVKETGVWSDSWGGQFEVISLEESELFSLMRKCRKTLSKAKSLKNLKKKE